MQKLSRVPVLARLFQAGLLNESCFLLPSRLHRRSLWIWRRHPTLDSLHGCASKSRMQMFTTTVGQRQKWAYSTMVKYVKAPL
ncbi:hypothetical protein K7X08_020320 [Anisodus acutangulus]|uniref:Uncharacterized protein n=1 Tax=Anisodus acutangulus TaxID=402998 RepID=A0A9Q1M8G5_9SOLA|nr:hypothetical protein K7X08_020320 [Anisodus acutangulus]